MSVTENRLASWKLFPVRSSGSSSIPNRAEPAQLANRIDISRRQLVNGLQARFPLSDWASARLRDVLLVEHQGIEGRAA